MAALRPRASELRTAGGELAIIGSGAPWFAKAFREDLELGDLRMRCDPELRSYALAGFTRGAMATFNLSAAANYVRALRSGQRQRRTQGDPLQQGGAMVVGRGGEVSYRFASRVAGDHPPFDALVAALRRVA